MLKMETRLTPPENTWTFSCSPLGGVGTSAVTAGFASDMSAMHDLSKQVLRDYTISFSKPKTELLTLWVLSPPPHVMFKP